MARHDLWLWMDRALLYPEGLRLELNLQLRTPLGNNRSVQGFFPWIVVDNDQLGSWRHHHDPQPSTAADIFRFGIEYADGRSAEAIREDRRHDRAEAAPEGEEIVLSELGGHGGQHSFHQALWLWPVPPSGAVTLHVAWPALEIDETRFVIGAEALADAANRVQLLWADP